MNLNLTYATYIINENYKFDHEYENLHIENNLIKTKTRNRQKHLINFLHDQTEVN